VNPTLVFFNKSIVIGNFSNIFNTSTIVDSYLKKKIKINNKRRKIIKSLKALKK
jgi:hypothetical protein